VGVAGLPLAKRLLDLLGPLVGQLAEVLAVLLEGLRLVVEDRVPALEIVHGGISEKHAVVELVQPLGAPIELLLQAGGLVGPARPFRRLDLLLQA
jgi:hypothetical protein